jgi:hypothetical protein
MLQHAILAAAAVIEVLALAGWAAFTAGYEAGHRQQGLTEKPLAAANPARRPRGGDRLDHQEDDGPWRN